MNDKTEVQIYFVNAQLDEGHRLAVLKQKALSAVKLISKEELLSALKGLYSEVSQGYTEESQAMFISSFSTVKMCIGWDSMTEQEQQSINDYLNS